VADDTAVAIRDSIACTLGALVLVFLRHSHTGERGRLG
jgi:hypothetical protein